MSLIEKKEKTAIHVMIDTETLGLSPGAMMLSVGAVVFDIDKGLGKQFYMEIDPETYRGYIDMSTLRFWFDQAVKGNVPPLKGESHAGVVAELLYNWLNNCNGKDSKLILWANGTDFDIPKLTRLLNRHSPDLPWKYNDVRDYRTVVKMFGAYGIKPDKTERHNALADAKWQALHLISIIKNVQEFVTVYEM